MSDKFRKILLATSALIPLGLASVSANPLGGVVVGGSAVIQSQGTPNVIVNQNSNSAIINWNTFNIGANERTQFVQPSASSVALNRVTGGLGPSQILGTLTGNGQIFVVNPDGILFGPNSKVDAAGFLATTHDITNADFMAGKYNFSIPGRPDASIVNLGTITAQNGGFAALVAPGVRNSGTITARLGKISLASANSFSLDFYGDSLIKLSVNDSIAATVKDVATGAPLSALVSNEGTLRANGGTVQLTAVAARQIVDAVINNRGVIEANSVGTRNGMIVISAATAATKPAGLPVQAVKISGKISAAGKQKNTKGGTVVITGENIALTGATIDASGLNGGGVVLIGGDTSGGRLNPAVASIPTAALESYAVATASTVTVDAASKIDVSAKDTGNAGKTIVWADQSTNFSGTILALGGSLSGNGGFVEVSGHERLAYAGWVDTSAPRGERGTLLLDPQDVTIGTIGAWVITSLALENALASGNVIVTTNGAGTDAGDITVAQSFSWSTANTLTLSANRNITINNSVTIANTNAGSLNLRADSLGTGVGTVSFLGTGKIDFSQSTGLVSIFYDPSDNPAGSIVNPTSYVSPTDYSPFVLINGAVPNQLTAYMLVNTVYDLQNIQNNLSGSYALGKDIHASVTSSWNAGNGFTPIGDLHTPFGFIGILDGQGHVIDALTINNAPSYAGLFGIVGTTGLIRGINLTNALVTQFCPGCGGSAAMAGILAGLNRGTIEASSTTGTVASYGNANNAIGGAAGGLVGQNFGLIRMSHSSATILHGDPAGGLVGLNWGTIDQAYATGDVHGTSLGITGGFVGTNAGIIANSYATGDVFEGGIPADNMGGFVGVNLGTISHSYSLGSLHIDIVGFSIGAFVGDASSGTIIDSYWNAGATLNGNCCITTDGAAIGTSPLTIAQLQAGLPNGFDSSVWGTNPTVNGGLPYLKWQVVTAPSAPIILTGGPPVGIIPITVTADSFSRIYGTTDPILTYHITSGSLSGTDTFSGSLARVPGENVGTYTISLGTLSLPPMYTLTYVSGTLTVTPATLTITANNQSRPLGTANPAFTASYSGFVAGDDPSVVSGLTLSTSATTTSPAGAYRIVPGGATAQNYTINYVNGTLTITNTLPPGTPPTPPATVFNNQQLMLPINWSIANSTPSTATVIRPSTADALEAANLLADFVQGCASRCLEGESQVAAGLLVSKAFEASGVVPKISSEPQRYRIIVASANIAIDVVIVGGLIAGAPAVVAIAGTVGTAFFISELVVRPIVGSE